MRRPRPTSLATRLARRLRLLLGLLVLVPGRVDAADLSVPVLLYHRLAAVSGDEMTVTLPVLEAQLQQIAAQGRRVVPLSTVLAALADPAAALPPGAVAITVDDGHRSVYTDLMPLLRRWQMPATLFVYPSAISNADYAMTWAQLAELKASGLFDIQSHTYWHPNFTIERKRLAPEAYLRFARDQLGRSKAVLEQRLGGSVDQLAWAFGLHDLELEKLAQDAGYRAAWTIERRPVTRQDRVMALPRYIVTDYDRGARFDGLLQGTSR